MEVASVRPRTPYSPSPGSRTGGASSLSMQDLDADDHGSECSIRASITEQAGGTFSTGAHTAADSYPDIAIGAGATPIEGPQVASAGGPYSANVSGVDNSALTCTFGPQGVGAERELPVGLIVDQDPEDSDFLPVDDPDRGGKRPCYDLDSRSNLNCHCRLKRNMTLSVVHHHHHQHHHQHQEPHHHHSDPEHHPSTRPPSPLFGSSSSSPNRPSNSTSRGRTHTHTQHSARCSHSINANVNHPRSPLGLLDLPNEIVLSILEDLPCDDLYSFSFTSRKLHELALGCYLARYGVGPLRRHRLMLFDEVHTERVVRALSAALFRPVLNSVYCSLTWGGKGAAGSKARSEMQTLGALLDKACSVREAVVNVDRVNGGAGGDADADEGDIVPEFTRVLDCALRKGCQSLLVYHSGTYTPDVEAIEDTVIRSFTGVRGLVKKYTPSTWAHASLSWISNSRNNTPQQPVSGSLTHFGLHSPILFHPKICSWTIDTLNASSLTTLTISHQLSAPPHLWAVVLPHITIPKLSRLSIDLVALASEDLFRFLKRHESIERLDIGRSMGPPNPFIPFPKNTLKNARHLSGPPKWLAHMLLQPGSLPLVKRATIVWRERGAQRLCASFMGVHVVLMPVLERMKGMKEVGLEMSFGSVSTDWIPNGRGYEYGAQGTSHLAATGPMGGGGGAGWALSSISTTHDAAAAGQSSIEIIQSAPTSIVYTHTTHLELEIKSYSVPFGIMTQRFGRWLGEFERLRWLGLRTLSSGDTAEAEGGGGAPFASVLQKDMFVDSVKTACPKIEVVEFGAIEEDGVY